MNFNAQHMRRQAACLAARGQSRRRRWRFEQVARRAAQ